MDSNGLKKAISQDIIEMSYFIEQYRNIKTGKVILDTLNTESFIDSLFLTSHGNQLHQAVTDIMLFWGKVANPTLSLRVFLEVPLILLNSIIGDKWYKRGKELFEQLKEKVDETSSPSRSKIKTLDKMIPIKEEDYSLIGSMSILMFTGLIDDYINSLSNEFGQFIKEKERPQFRKEIKKGTNTQKICKLLDFMQLKEFIFIELYKYDLISIVTDFDDFRRFRNRIAHEGAKIDYLELKDEIKQIKGYLSPIIEKQINDNSELKLAWKEAFIKFFDSFYPSIIFPFLLYFKILPYLLIIDRSFTIWKNHKVRI